MQASHWSSQKSEGGFQVIKWLTNWAEHSHEYWFMFWITRVQRALGKSYLPISFSPRVEGVLMNSVKLVISIHMSIDSSSTQPHFSCFSLVSIHAQALPSKQLQPSMAPASRCLCSNPIPQKLVLLGVGGKDAIASHVRKHPELVSGTFPLPFYSSSHTRPVGYITVKLPFT